MNEGTCTQEKESPVFQQFGVIDNRLAELSKTSQTLAGRLSHILSAQKPETEEDSGKAECESALVEKLYSIRNKIEAQISFLQDVTNRLTI